MNKKTVSIISIIIIIGAFFAFNQYTKKNSQKKIIQVNAILAKITPEEIIKESDGIILGTVKELKITKEPSNLRPGKKDIITNAIISVEKYMYNPKNLSFPEITVQAIGGTFENETMLSEESPSFENGQRVIIFLKQKENNIFTIYGWAQGKFTIGSDNMLGNNRERVFFRNIFGKEMKLDEFENHTKSSFSSLPK